MSESERPPRWVARGLEGRFLGIFDHEWQAEAEVRCEREEAERMVCAGQYDALEKWKKSARREHQRELKTTAPRGRKGGGDDPAL